MWTCTSASVGETCCLTASSWTARARSMLVTKALTCWVGWSRSIVRACARVMVTCDLGLAAKSWLATSGPTTCPMEVVSTSGLCACSVWTTSVQVSGWPLTVPATLGLLGLWAAAGPPGIPGGFGYCPCAATIAVEHSAAANSAGMVYFMEKSFRGSFPCARSGAGRSASFYGTRETHGSSLPGDSPRNATRGCAQSTKSAKYYSIRFQSLQSRRAIFPSPDRLQQEAIQKPLAALPTGSPVPQSLRGLWGGLRRA